MFDTFVIISLVFIAVGFALAIKGKGMFTSKATIVGAVVSTSALLAIPLHWNGVL